MSVNNIIMAAAGASGAGAPFSWNGNSNTNLASSTGISANFRGEIYTSNSYTFGAPPSIMKLNINGALQWQRSVSSSQMNAVSTDGEGNAYIFGRAPEPYVAKFNSSGALVFQNTLDVSGGSQGNFYHGFYDYTTNSLYAVGFTPRVDLTQVGLIVRMDPTGSVTWQKTLRPSGGSTPGLVLSHATTDYSGNLIVVGRGTDPSSDQVAPIVAKYNSSGTLLWNVYLYFDGSYTADGNGVATDSSGNIYVNGNLDKQSGVGINITPFVCKLNSSGVMQWSRWLNNGRTGDCNFALDTVRGILYCPLQGTSVNDIYTTIYKLDTSGTVVGSQGLQANAGSTPAFNLDFVSIANYSGQSILYGAGLVSLASSQNSMINFKALNGTVISGGGITSGPTVGSITTAALTSANANYIDAVDTGSMVSATNVITTTTFGWTVYS